VNLRQHLAGEAYQPLGIGRDLLREDLERDLVSLLSRAR
jgi:hypothetical protein